MFSTFFLLGLRRIDADLLIG